MSHPTRVISRLDIKGPNLVKGLQFEGIRVMGTAQQFSEIYYHEGADELIYQDVVVNSNMFYMLHHLLHKMEMMLFNYGTTAYGLKPLVIQMLMEREKHGSM